MRVMMEITRYRIMDADRYRKEITIKRSGIKGREISFSEE